MRIADTEIHRVADAWRRAFEGAHGKKPPAIVWNRGWFRIRNTQEWSPRYRRSKIEDMTKVLRKGFTQS